MKKAALQVATVFGAFTFLGVANATEIRTPLVPLPSIDDFTNGDGWGFGLGLAVEYETAYEGSDEYEFEADPAGGVQWRTGENIFFWAGEAVGWRTLVKDSWLFQIPHIALSLGTALLTVAVLIYLRTRLINHQVDIRDKQLTY